MISDLQRAFETLTAKSAVFTKLWNYYDGDQPLIYTNDRLREVFQNVDARFSENWCAVVVDSEAERIRLKEFSLPQLAPEPAAAALPPGQAVPVTPKPAPNPFEQRLNDLFRETELNLDADDVHLAALVCGESYVFAWRDDEIGIEAYYHDPRMAHIFYDPEHPRQKLFAAKWWVGEDDEKRYLNLYYADRIEYYVSTQKAFAFSTWKGMKEAKPAEPHEFGVVPCFHFRVDRRKTTSRLDNVIEPQNVINKLLSDMMVAAEFGAFRQRYVISAAGIKTLKNAPNEIWDLPAGDGPGQQTSAGEFSATELSNYLSAMDKTASAIGAISRTPKHYFFAQSGDPSGEALIALEAPLNKKAQSAIDRFLPTWAELGSFLLELDGVEGVQRKDIQPIFDEPATVQPRTEAEIRQIDVNTGIPLVTTLRRSGWTESEIEQMQEDKAEAAAQTAAVVPGSKLQPGDMQGAMDNLKRLGLTDLLPEDAGNGTRTPAQ